MLLPYYKILGSNQEWKYNKATTEYHRWYLKSDQIKLIAQEAITQNSNHAMARFNPYTDLSAGGVTLGFNGSNYWFPADRPLGKILYRIFKTR